MEFGFAYVVAQLGLFLFCRRLIVALREGKLNLVETFEGIWIFAVAVAVWLLILLKGGVEEPERLAWIAVPLLASPIVYHVALRRRLRPLKVLRYSELGNVTEKMLMAGLMFVSALLLIRFVQVTLRQLVG